MPDKEVEQKEETELLSTQRLRAENEALTKRVTALEKQVKDMINELSSGSYTIVDNTDGSSTNKKEDLERKVKKVFGNGKID